MNREKTSFTLTPFKTRSHIKIGNLTIQNDKKWNWFHRLMFKLIFGIEIENIKIL